MYVWNSVIHLFIFRPHCTACGILVPWPGIQPAPPALEARGLHHWTTREVLILYVYKSCQTVTTKHELTPPPGHIVALSFWWWELLRSTLLATFGYVIQYRELSSPRCTLAHPVPFSVSVPVPKLCVYVMSSPIFLSPFSGLFWRQSSARFLTLKKI